MRRLLVSTGVAAALFLSAPAQAAPPADRGRITGVVSSTSEARALPCPPVDQAVTARESVGVTCFPKRSNRWSIDQVGGCMLKADTTTGYRMMGTCVLAIDEGAHIKVWAPAGSVSEDYRVVWR